MAKAKARQQQFEGMESPKIPAIESLAEQYLELGSELARLRVKCGDKKDLLIAKMKEHDLTFYEFDGKTIKLVSGKVDVQIKDEELSTVEKGRRHLNGKKEE